MTIRTLVALALTLCFSAPLYAQQVWKCVAGGQTTFSDVPCPTEGQQLDKGRLDTNVMKAVRPPPERDPNGNSARSSYATRAQVQHQDQRHGQRDDMAQRSSCPSELEIRNMEVKAGSITLGEEEKDFIREEIRRARQCAKGQGNYTVKDWDISRQAVRDQGNIKGGEDARQRAEGMHSAADPVEGDRIQQRRIAEDDRRAALEQRAAENAIKNAQPKVTSTCDRGGCWGTDGTRYNAVGGNRVLGPNGVPCRVVGATLQCP